MLKKIAHLTLLASLIAIAAPGQVHAASRLAAVDPRIGNDISYPQCGVPLPTAQAYGIVGVNGGTASTINSCLATELRWAQNTRSSTTAQPKLQLYVNTANPYEDIQAYGVKTWPTNNADSTGTSSLDNPDPRLANPYGACTTDTAAYGGYNNSLACSWQYGWNRSVDTLRSFQSVAAGVSGISINPADYPWWLDVETTNSWQMHGGADGQAKNTASLQGMKQYYESRGVSRVGLYSTSLQWGQIVGSTLSIPTADSPTTGANLRGLDSWLAGASSVTDAKKRCSTRTGLTGGRVLLNQYVVRSLDYNYSCI